MELIAYARCNDALKEIFWGKINQDEIELIKNKLITYRYSEAYQVLPDHIRNNANVEYLFKGIGKVGIAENSKSLIPLLRVIGSDKSLDIQSIINLRMHKPVSWRKYKLYLAQTYINYELFYGIRKDKMFIFAAHANSFHDVLLGRSDKFDFLLILLLLCESGRNLEVAINLPASVKLGKDLTSILEVKAPFASEPSCWLSSFKVRGHVTGLGVQEEDIVIPLNTPLYRYLQLLDSIRSKNNPNRESFFSIKKSNRQSYLRDFTQFCWIKNSDGSALHTIQTRKFRKVWSGEVLLQYMGDINTKDDLIKAVGEDLRNTIPLTYLLQSSRTETMLASAIVGLQLRFLEDHKNLAAEIKLKGEKPENGSRIKRYFCDCTDPYNPDYLPDLDTEYCKQFDMCLGCSKAVVYEEHIPNIIYRCFQYEKIIKDSPELYATYYEIKHQRARQALERFRTKSKHGESKHAEAVKIAVEAWENPAIHLLPPLIHQNINNINVININSGEAS